ncbi:spermidine synthase [archaeon]|nr:spermidine synthase [archaeon]
MSEKTNEKSKIIEELFESIIPTNFLGEQYCDDVALIFKPEKILVDEKTKYQKINIINTKSYGRILFIDNLLMKTDKDGHIINEMIVHPIMLTGKKKKKILVVGGGEGFTATLLLNYPYIEKIDIVDIDDEFVEICKKIYPEKMACLNNSKVNLIIKDGLEYLKETKETYDAIFTTPTDPLTISDPLFVKEYYRLCFERLADDGIFQTDAYMPHYKYGNIDYAYIRKLLSEFFSISKIYIATIPTFPGGLFAFGFASKKYDPEKDLNEFDFNIKTKYYNKDTHFASFKLPQFMIERINEENKKK